MKNEDFINENAENNSKENDFLEQFFRENELFSHKKEKQVNKKSVDKKQNNTDYLKLNTKNTSVQKIPDFPKEKTLNTTKISQSKKDINLKQLFQNIELEKNKHSHQVKKEIKKHISGKNHLPASYVPTIEMIKLQSEFRLLFENFLKILPIIEKSARLQEIEERYTRESRSNREYFPELWENEGSIIFKEIQNEKKQKEEEKIFLAQQKKREEEIIALQQQEELLQKQEAEEERKKNKKQEEENHQKFLALQQQERLLQQEQEKALLVMREKKRQREKENRENREKKIKKIKHSIVRFSDNIQSSTINTTRNIISTAQQKISEISLKRKKYIQKKSEENKKREAQILKLRALKRENKRREAQTESGILEGIKIISMVAGLFLIAMITLNSGAILEVTEKYWNAKEYAEKQISTKNLVQQSSESVKNTFKNIPSLPVAGPIAETKNGFDTKMYLNISPPDTRIVIPKLGKNIPILSVQDDSREQENWDKLEKDIQKALQDGVVHYPGTANPGQNGNVFITGHSSYYPWDKGKYKDVFAALHDLEVGDEYFIFHKGKKYRYIITTRKIVPPSDVSVLEQDTSKKISTLMTCTPIGTTRNRLILQAKEAGISY